VVEKTLDRIAAANLTKSFTLLRLVEAAGVEIKRLENNFFVIVRDE
jgi:hypothetical protein